jgi:hypothetical protein
MQIAPQGCGRLGSKHVRLQRALATAGSACQPCGASGRRVTTSAPGGSSSGSSSCSGTRLGCQRTARNGQAATTTTALCDAAVWSCALCRHLHHCQQCLRRGRRRQALGLQAMMQRSFLLPDVLAHNAAINAGAKGKQRQQALGPWMLPQRSNLMPDFCTCDTPIVPLRRASSSSGHLVLGW